MKFLPHNTFLRRNQLKKLLKKKKRRQLKSDPNLKVSFWKEKYYSVVLVLQANTIDLELENQLLRSENKLIDSQRRQVPGSKQDKKKEAVNINSRGVNIFVNSEFKTIPSNTR
jgi:hypothetical protein